MKKKSKNIAGKINIKCTHCGKKKSVKRDDSDPLEAVLMETQCEKCIDGDFSDVSYYDKDGNEVFQQ